MYVMRSVGMYEGEDEATRGYARECSFHGRLGRERERNRLDICRVVGRRIIGVVWLDFVVELRCVNLTVLDVCFIISGDINFKVILIIILFIFTISISSGTLFCICGSIICQTNRYAFCNYFNNY